MEGLGSTQLTNVESYRAEAQGVSDSPREQCRCVRISPSLSNCANQESSKLPEQCDTITDGQIENVPNQKHFGYDFEMCQESHEEFQKLWIKKKESAEQAAEIKAKSRLQSWQLDKVSLEQAIDHALKDYSEMYERAHAIRLFFEKEKMLFQEEIQRKLSFSSRFPACTETFVKRARYEDFERNKTSMHSSYGLQLLNEFQYTISDEECCDETEPHNSSNKISQKLFDKSIFSTPSSKQHKKFEIPTKLEDRTPVLPKK
jgi:hypothetical protein